MAWSWVWKPLSRAHPKARRGGRGPRGERGGRGAAKNLVVALRPRCRRRADARARTPAASARPPTPAAAAPGSPPRPFFVALRGPNRGGRQDHGGRQNHDSQGPERGANRHQGPSGPAVALRRATVATVLARCRGGPSPRTIAKVAGRAGRLSARQHLRHAVEVRGSGRRIGAGAEASHVPAAAYRAAA